MIVAAGATPEVSSWPFVDLVQRQPYAHAKTLLPNRRQLSRVYPTASDASSMPLNPAINPFFDAQGKPAPKPAVTCVIDLLGYSQFIASTRRTDYPSRVAELQEVLARAHKAAEDASAASEHQPRAESAFKTFTDNLLIATPFNPDDDAYGEVELTNMIQLAAGIQLSLLEDGFLSRGGIGVGWSYLDDRLGFGAGIVDAANCDVSGRPPAVLLSANAVELVRRHAHFYGTDGWWPQLIWLRQRPDSSLVVNFFSELFLDIREGIVNFDRVTAVRDRIWNGLTTHSANAAVLAKYRSAAAMFDDAATSAYVEARKSGQTGIRRGIACLRRACRPKTWTSELRTVSVARVPPGDPPSDLLRKALDPGAP